MDNTKLRQSRSGRYRTRSVLAVAALALAIVVAVISVNRSAYFQLRPVSGAANALSHAADPPENRPDDR